MTGCTLVSLLVDLPYTYGIDYLSAYIPALGSPVPWELPYQPDRVERPGCGRTARACSSHDSGDTYPTVKLVAYPTVGLPYRRLRLVPRAPPGPPRGRGRCPPTRRSRPCAGRKGSNPRAGRVARLLGRGRFLEFAIQKGGSEIVHARGTFPAHAPPHNLAGGYMRGKQMGRKRATAAASPAPGRLQTRLLGAGADCWTSSPALL